MSDIGTHEASELLGVTVPTVIAWIKSGRLDGLRELKGNRSVWRCTKESVARLRPAGGGDVAAIEQRLGALESRSNSNSPLLARALRDWLTAEDVAARRRRQLIELLSSAETKS